MLTLAQSACALAAGKSSRSLVEECLARIADPAGQGSSVFLKVDAEAPGRPRTRLTRVRAPRAAPSPLAGIPVSVKDLFDLAGESRGGLARARRRAARAPRRAGVARLRAAGLIPSGAPT